MGANLTVPEVDLRGKVAIVTGGNTGIGYELVKGLAEMGAHTIMAARSEERATAAIARMKESVGTEKELNVEFLKLADLASFQSTKDFVRSFKEKNLPLHILINNAGIAWIPFTKTDDGNEMTYQVNHLGPFLLTLELLPIILETASSSGDGRILFVSSEAHQYILAGEVNFDNLNAELEYHRYKAYGRTKLYNVMTTFALQRRLQNVSITVSAQHPGVVKTEISRGFQDSWFFSVLAKIADATIARTPKEGAATTLNCAVNPALNSQQALYYASCKEAACNPDARNEQYQEELWRRSIEALRDHLSPEILDKYGPTLSPPPHGGNEDELEKVLTGNNEDDVEASSRGSECEQENVPIGGNKSEQEESSDRGDKSDQVQKAVTGAEGGKDTSVSGQEVKVNVLSCLHNNYID